MLLFTPRYIFHLPARNIKPYYISVTQELLLMESLGAHTSLLARSLLYNLQNPPVKAKAQPLFRYVFQVW